MNAAYRSQFAAEQRGRAVEAIRKLESFADVVIADENMSEEHAIQILMEMQKVAFDEGRLLAEIEIRKKPENVERIEH